MNKSSFSIIKDVYCPCCGVKSIYEDLNEDAEFYEGQAVYCKSCSAGGYINMCLKLSESRLKNLKNQPPA